MKNFRKLLVIPALLYLAGCAPENNSPVDPGTNEEVSDLYSVFNINITTSNHAPIVSKEEYLPCNIEIEGNKLFSDFSGSAMIRGRGNSSWLWYDKKPYRIKLDKSAGILGLKKNRDWVLLANYRDPTKLMNTFAFEAASWLGIAYPNHTRYVEVTLNGSYIGLYQLTEQIEQGENRVDIDQNSGVLLSFDADDGPDLSPDATNNFWSEVFSLPVTVKYPEDPGSARLMDLKTDLARLEKAINSFDYAGVDSLMDISSFINYLILQELVYNVEIDAPRSVFLFRDKGGKFTLGPAWDFDAGYDFDWNSMYTGHNFFNAQELVLGTDPATHKNGYAISGFFTQLFRNAQFLSQYKTRWNQVSDSIVSHSWKIMEQYKTGIREAVARDFKRWPIDKTFETETARMETWLYNRVTYLNTVINGYPVPTIKTDCGTIDLSLSLSWKLGYSQTQKITIDQSSLLDKLGITNDQLNTTTLNMVPLKPDGTEGENHTNGTYGGWFDKDNIPGYWDNGHVFIEINQDLLNWSCGLRAATGYCMPGDKHQVKMQYQYTEGFQTKTVTVTVNFTIGS